MRCTELEGQARAGDLTQGPELVRAIAAAFECVRPSERSGRRGGWLMNLSIAAIIVLTAACDAHAGALEIKADAWLVKPFNLEALFACITPHAGEPSVRLVGVL